MREVWTARGSRIKDAAKGENAHSDYLKVDDNEFWLLRSKKAFEAWRSYQIWRWNHAKAISSDEWVGPGWYCIVRKEYDFGMGLNRQVIVQHSSERLDQLLEKQMQLASTIRRITAVCSLADPPRKSFKAERS